MTVSPAPDKISNRSFFSYTSYPPRFIFLKNRTRFYRRINQDLKTVAPSKTPIIPVILMTKVVNENPVFDATGDAREVSGMIGTVVFPDSYSGSFSDADSTKIEPSCGSMDVLF